VGMYSIGDVAQLAGVSPRVLRHYDEIGLFTPHEIGTNGYRRYAPSQLPLLQRILALRDLGFRLDQIGALVRDDIPAEQLRTMLRRRQSELEDELEETSRRLAQVHRHLEALGADPTRTGGRTMSPPEITVRAVPAAHVAELRGVSPTYDPVDVGPTISPLYTQLFEQLRVAGVVVTGGAIAYYEEDPGGDGILVHAAAPIATRVDAIDGLHVVDLPGLERAACAMHVGPMADIVGTVRPMLDWIADHGLRTTGLSREVYVHCPPDQTEWRTEIQFPVEPY
jgi:DNA-binding transcriptional MerR regulator/effector-binding domain-containing protein